MLACMPIGDEVDAAIKESGNEIPVLYMPSGTHDQPEKMNKTLQRIIDSLTDIDYLLLPMGRCGNATVGLRSDRFSLVLPRCEDCVNLLLSKDSLKVDRPKGCMFFSRGWVSSNRSPQMDYERTCRKYGKEQGDMITQMIYGGYRWFGLMDTGRYPLDMVQEALTPLANAIPVDFKVLEAPCGVLKKMARLEFDDDFVIVPPGEVVTEEMLERG